MHLDIKALLNFSNEFVKLSSEITVFTFVPKEAINSIQEKGLLSAAELIKDNKALSLARPNDKLKFKEKVKKELKNPETKDLISGVSAFFTLPDWSKISNKHYINKLKLVPISINLSEIMANEPKTKLIGVELSIYDEDMSDEEFNLRQRELQLREVAKYSLMDPKELWEGYDITQTTHYASDVPHLIIYPPNKKIEPKYLKL